MHDFYISLHFFQEKVLKYVEARNNFLQFDFHFFLVFFRFEFQLSDFSSFPLIKKANFTIKQQSVKATTNVIDI